MSASPGVLLADAHIHLFEHGFRGRDAPVAGITDELAAYAGLRSEFNIARSLVVGYEGVPRHAGNNAYVAGLAAAHEWIVPMAYVPTRPAPQPGHLAELAAAGFVGVACWVTSADEADGLGAWPAESLETVGRSFRVVSLNARASLIARLADPVVAMEPATVLFSHLGLPGRHRRVPGRTEVRERLDGLFDLADRQHVGVKASGLYALAEEGVDAYAIAAPYLAEIIEVFGARRVYWGSDFVPVLARIPFRQAVRLPLDVSGEEERLIMGDNLLRLLGGSPAGVPFRRSARSRTA